MVCSRWDDYIIFYRSFTLPKYILTDIYLQSTVVLNPLNSRPTPTTVFATPSRLLSRSTSVGLWVHMQEIEVNALGIPKWGRNVVVRKAGKLTSVVDSNSVIPTITIIPISYAVNFAFRIRLHLYHPFSLSYLPSIFVPYSIAYLLPQVQHAYTLYI